MVALLSVKIGCWLSLPPAHEVPTVMPPQSTVVLLITLPAVHEPVATELAALEEAPALEDEELLVGAVLLRLLLLLLLELEHMGVFQFAGFTHVRSQGTLPQQEPDAAALQLVLLLELTVELLDDELLVFTGTEHSFVPPATLPPKVASLQTKLPVRVL
jgi:hypothetical protein